MNVTRRHVISGLAAALAGSRISAPAQLVAAEQKVPQRIVGLDRLAAQLLLSVGVPPIATDVRDYLAYGAVLPLPTGVVDFGSSNEPNLELLQALKPDLLVSSMAPADTLGPISEIAPSLFLPIYAAREPPLTLAISTTRRMGDIADRRAIAAASINEFQSALDLAKRRLSKTYDRSFLLVGLEPDGRHATVYGKNSIMQDVADRVGMDNVWTEQTNAYGFISAGIEHLMGWPASVLLYMDEGAITTAALNRLAAIPLWTDLPFVKTHRLARLPAFDPLGALPSAQAFALSASSLLAHAEAEGG